jgi:hypothetical protein
MDANNLWNINVIKDESESNDELLLRAKRYAQALAHRKKLEEEQKKAQQFAIKVLKAWKAKNSSIVIYM